jgi:thiol-disulfide isomerase/thioredoxin
MKKTVFTFMITCLALGGFAQIDSSQQYFKSPYIPAFNIRKLPDSSSFTNNMLQKDKPVIVVFFDPDCDHCQHATKNFTAKMDRFKDVQILMVTIYEFSRIKKFSNDYKLSKFPNIILTRDVGFDLPRFYNVSSLPDVYVYDKDGKLIKHYKQDIPVDEIATLF